MKYTLLVDLDENALGDAEWEDCDVRSAGLTRELDAEGRYLDAAPRHPTDTATSVPVRDGYRVVTEPIPGARFGTIEVRPVLDIPGIPGR
jgi:hypothetical protein